VQTALSKLCREGLLDRRARRGTYVKGDKSTLTCAGFYFDRPFSRADSAFYQALGSELRRKLGEKGVKVRVWTDEREEAEQGEPIESLKRAMEKREIQALIAPVICGNDVGWIKACEIPTAVMTGDLSIKSGVSLDFLTILRLGLTELRKQGVRTVGVINSLLMQDGASSSSVANFYPSLVEIMHEVGLETRNEWIRLAREYTQHFSNFGHRQFHELWELPQRPEGLIVFPDGVAVGVITAILERRIEVPQALKVVFHANDLLPYVCPFKALFLQTEVGRIADALLETVYTQLAGGKVRPVQVPLSLVRRGSPFSVN
jgi:DNA-binding LacI/PurR family transcriptional regulator